MPSDRTNMPFAATVLTLYPDMFPGPLGLSMSGRGLQDGLWSLEARDIPRPCHRQARFS